MQQAQKASKVQTDREGILEKVIQILRNMTSDWDTGFSGPIAADTCLVSDLMCESIDIVQFVVALEECFGRRDLPMEELLMIDGRYVDDLRVAEVVDFLCKHLTAEVHS
jgi:acyl carrier protein